MSDTLSRPDAPLTRRLTHAPAATAPTSLYRHQAYPHVPQNVNEIHAIERRRKAQRTGWRGRLSATNLAVATRITMAVSTMWCAYAFVALAIFGFPGWHATAPQYVQWFSQTFLQLVFLPIIAVGTAVLNRHAELQAEQQYHATIKTFHDAQETVHHLDAQDVVILRMEALITSQKAEIAVQGQQIAALAAALATTSIAAAAAVEAATSVATPASAPDPTPNPTPDPDEPKPLVTTPVKRTRSRARGVR